MRVMARLIGLVRPLTGYMLLAIAMALATAVTAVCFSFLGSDYACLVSAVPFIGIAVLYCLSERGALKVKEVATPRLIRLTAAYTLVMLGVCVGLAFAMGAVARTVNAEWYDFLRYVPFAIVPLLSPVVLAAVCFAMKAYEVPHTARFIRAAKAELDKSDAVKVGITGSFGKTSVKHFAAAILSLTFLVFSSIPRAEQIILRLSFAATASTAKRIPPKSRLHRQVLILEVSEKRKIPGASTAHGMVWND